MTFADGFDVFRKTTFSLLGVYTCPWNAPEHMRSSPHYQFPLCIAPMGVSTQSVTEILASTLSQMCQGIEMAVGPYCEQATMVSFDLFMTGDMPQQNKNCSINSYQSARSCHFYNIKDHQQWDADYDIIANARYRCDQDKICQLDICTRQGGAGWGTGLLPLSWLGDGHLSP